MMWIQKVDSFLTTSSNLASFQVNENYKVGETYMNGRICTMIVGLR